MALKKDLYVVQVKSYVNGSPVVSTIVVRACTTGEAEKRAEQVLSKRNEKLGCCTRIYDSAANVLRCGIIGERPWNNPR